MSVSTIITLLCIVVAVWLATEFLDRLVSPWLARRRVYKLLAAVKTGRVPKKTHFDYEICFDATAFSVVGLKKPTAARLSMDWSEVHKVVAFKRDLFTFDLVCLFFRRSDDSGLELDEDMKGWSEFIAVLPGFLPTCNAWEQWFPEVAFPAFATNLKDIFSRGDAQSVNLVPSISTRL